MKRLTSTVAAVLLGLLLWARPASATWTLVAHAVSGNADGQTGPFRAPHAGSVSTTGADAYWCALSHYDSTQVTAGDLSDSTSAGYTLVASGPSAAGDTNTKLAWFYKLAPTTSASEAWTFQKTGANSGQFGGLSCFAVSGTAASPTISHTESGATSSTPSAGSLGSSGDLVLTAVADYTVTVSSIDSSFAIIDQSNYTGSNNIGIATAWQNLSAGVGGAVNPTWTLSGSPTASAVQAVSVTGTGGGGGATSPGQTSLTMLGVGMAVLLGLIVWKSVSAVDDLRIAYDNAREQSNDMQLQALCMQYVRPETPRERVMARLREQKPPTC